tara:strand:- start:220 stop:876 length:657 start_codon:yes stop_codon:yes gene_type:complete
MSTYPIFKNKKNETLVFYSCPKNGNTSAKLFFAKHLGIENNFYFTQDQIPKFKYEESSKKVLEIKKSGKKTNLVNIWPNHQKFEKVDATYKCCIIRDPIERFLSAYRNRILFHKDSDFFEYTIDSIIDNLLNNNFKNKHFLPQYYYLGNDLSYYNFCENINKIKEFEKYINNFFGNNIFFPKLQTGGNDKKIELSSNQTEKIKYIYKKDFDIFEKNFK